MKLPALHNFSVNKTAKLIVFLDILQIVSMSVLLFLLFFFDAFVIPEPYFLLFVALILICLLTAALDIFNAFPVSRLGMKNDSLTDALTSVEALNNELRSQRHDFLNHLQVVYSLIEMDEYDEAHDYIDHVYTDIHRVSGTLKTSHASINAILQAKIVMCTEKGIAVDTDIKTSLSQLPIESWELCRILGNLLDNAVKALEETKEPRIHIEMSETLQNYSIVVANNGPAIRPEFWHKIFEAGFSTSGTGHGMGLAICKSIVQGCNGTLKVFSNDSITTFCCTLPRAQR